MRLKFLFGLSFIFLSFGAIAQDSESCVTVPETVGEHPVAPMDFQLMVQFNCEFATYKLEVYNGGGELMFETTDTKSRWNAKDATPGDYFWKITGTTTEGEFREKGKFELLD